MKKLNLTKVVTYLVLAIFFVSIGASFYFFHVAQVRSHKSFISSAKIAKTDPLYDYEQYFNKLPKETLWIENGGLKQDAWYVRAKQKTDKTAVIVHGFSWSKERMKAYGWLFHKLGYNVLMPDNIAAGKSQGRIIGYGWNDRLNLIKWTELLVQRNHKSQITLFGLSMGAATVMMASGEETLPPQVHNLIEDAGYSSVWDELKFQAKSMYNLPAFPILYEVSAISKVRAGFSYGEASSVNQLKKNKLPILFIHGDRDTFVPTRMVYENYKATKGPKELYLVKGADHAETFKKDKQLYEKKIKEFLQKYRK